MLGQCRRRLLAAWFGLCLAGLLLLTGEIRPTDAASDNLVWPPYLQQLTDASVVILWATEEGDEPEVRYSSESGEEERAEGDSRDVEELNIRLHRVELSGLEPDATYRYRIYTDGEELMPDEPLQFRTAPPPGSDAPFTFLAFGDYGTGNDMQRRLRDQMRQESFQFIVTTGDNAYPRATYEQFDHYVFRLYDTIFPFVGLFPSLGNHDYLTDDAKPYLDLFDLPKNAANEEDEERYYSFDYGNAHFAVLDSNRLAEDDKIVETMADWLRDDLSATDLRWRIVVLHHPPYAATARQREDESEILREVFIPIFEEHDVNLVLAGHDHNYQRSRPLRGGEPTTVEEGGIVYLVTGAGSAADYLCDSEDADWLAVAYCGLRYGLYTRVTVEGDRLSVAAVDAGGALRDCFTLGPGADVPVATPVPMAPNVVRALAFPAEADARIEEKSPDENFGSSRFLRVDGGEDEEERSYLRFGVKGVRGLVESATLMLYAGGTTPHDTKVYLTDNDWSENEITWDARPDRHPGRIERQEAVGANSWIAYDVSNAVAGDGLYTFLLTGTSEDGVTFSSREGLIPPFLVLKYRPSAADAGQCGGS